MKKGEEGWGVLNIDIIGPERLSIYVCCLIKLQYLCSLAHEGQG